MSEDVIQCLGRRAEAEDIKTYERSSLTRPPMRDGAAEADVASPDADDAELFGIEPPSSDRTVRTILRLVHRQQKARDG